MPTGSETREFVLEYLSPSGGVTVRPMMGEYLLYRNGKLFGGIYDDRVLIKPTPAAEARLPGAERVVPYPGAKELLLVESTDPGFWAELLNAVEPELPVAKKKK